MVTVYFTFEHVMCVEDVMDYFICVYFKSEFLQVACKELPLACEFKVRLYLGILTLIS